MFRKDTQPAMVFEGRDYRDDVASLCEALIAASPAADINQLNTKYIKRQLLEAISNKPSLIEGLIGEVLKSSTNALTHLLCSPRKIPRSPKPFGETSSSRELLRMQTALRSYRSIGFNIQFAMQQAPLALHPADAIKEHRGDAYIIRAKAYFDRNNIAEALFNFDVGSQFKLKPENAFLDELIGASYILLNEYKASILYCNKLIKSDKATPPVRLYRAIAELMSPMPLVIIGGVRKGQSPFDHFLQGDLHPWRYLTSHVEDLYQHRRAARVLMSCLNDLDKLKLVVKTYGLPLFIAFLQVLPLRFYEAYPDDASYPFNMKLAAIQMLIAAQENKHRDDRDQPSLDALKALLSLPKDAPVFSNYQQVQNIIVPHTLSRPSQSRTPLARLSRWVTQSQIEGSAKGEERELTDKTVHFGPNAS
jgi:tetratricopeptide (TPR) repeat protein